MAFAPFTAYFRVIPSRGLTYTDPAVTTGVAQRGSRLDYVRDLQRLAFNAFQELADREGTYDDPVILPRPGGGQSRFEGAFGGVKYGAAATPQFGNSPALLMLEGFYSIDVESSEQPNEPHYVIHAGRRVLAGYTKAPYDAHQGAGSPTAAVEQEVSALKTDLESVLSVVSDDVGAIKLHRLVYKNITWGSRGHHFPR